MGHRILNARGVSHDGFMLGSGLPVAPALGPAHIPRVISACSTCPAQALLLTQTACMANRHCASLLLCSLNLLCCHWCRADSTDPPFIPTDPTPVHPQGRKSHEEVVTEAAQQLAQGQQRQERQERQERQQRALAQALAASPPRPKAAQPSAPPEEQLPPEETDSASQLGNDPPRSHRISDDNMSLSAESSAPSLTSGRATPDRGRRGLLNVYGSYDGT